MDNRWMYNDEYWNQFVEKEREALYFEAFKAVENCFKGTGLTRNLVDCLAVARKVEDTSGWHLWEDVLHLEDCHMWAIMYENKELNEYLWEKCMSNYEEACCEAML